MTSRLAPDLRARLMQAALVELDANGIEGVSIRAVARRAGVSHAAPGYEFGDRSGLLTALATEGFLRLAQALATAAQSAPEGRRARLIAVGEAYVRFARDNAALYALLFDSAELRRADPVLAEASGRAYAVITEATPGPPDALLAWIVVHGIAGLERSGALNRQFPTAEELGRGERHILERVADALGELD